jgi:hypothetical protein
MHLINGKEEPRLAIKEDAIAKRGVITGSVDRSW